MYEEGEEKPMPPADASNYRRLAALLNFVAQDRADVAFAAKEISRSMSNPLIGDFKAIKRAGWYLKGAPFFVYK